MALEYIYNTYRTLLNKAYGKIILLFFTVTGWQLSSCKSSVNVFHKKITYLHEES